MSDPILWSRADHTAAKHQVLRAFLNAWIPVMGHQAVRVRSQGVAWQEPRLLFVDGFAGPGVYSGGEPGSPIIMLTTLLEHRSFPSLSGVKFLFLFIEQDGRRVARLEQEIAALGPLPGNVSVEVARDQYERAFSSLITGIQERGSILIPTFAFIDPFGYSDSSMSLTGQLLDFPRCEALIFLPLSAVSRFVGRAGQENALSVLFGCDDWRDAISLEGMGRSDFLLELFERQVARGEHVRHVRSLRMRTVNGRDYRLVFALAHDKGLEIAKDAMWAVDPIAGTSYTATSLSGLPVLFTLEADTRPLLADLREVFGQRPFSIEEAEVRTLETHFRKAHLRRQTLKPAESRGEIEVVSTRAGRRRGDYPAGTVLRFTSS